MRCRPVLCLSRLWRDEAGVQTVEMLIGTIILGGAAAMVGYGLTTGYRGLAASIIRTIRSADPLGGSGP